MKRYKSLGEVQPAPFVDLIDRFVERRHAEIFDSNASRMEREGRAEGLGICEDKRDGQIMHFDLELAWLKKENLENHIAYEAGKMTTQECMLHNYATIEVEYCYELLRLAHYGLYGEIYDGKAELMFTDTAEEYNGLAKELGFNLVS
jgi:hypothetical protein